MGRFKKGNTSGARFGKDIDPREAQNKGAQTKHNKRLLAKIMEEQMVRVGELLHGNIDDFMQMVEKPQSQADRILGTALAQKKTAYGAYQDLADRVLGKPTQPTEDVTKEPAVFKVMKTK